MNEDKENNFVTLLKQIKLMVLSKGSIDFPNKLPKLYYFLNKDMFTCFVRNKTKQTEDQRIDAYAVLKQENEIITLTIHQPFETICGDYNDKLDIQTQVKGCGQECNILFTNLVNNVHAFYLMPGCWKKNWYRSKYIIKDALISESYNIEDSFNGIMLYIRDLDGFIGTTDDILDEKKTIF